MSEELMKDTQAKWYVLHTFSGYENVAKRNLENTIEKFSLQDRITEIIIPMEDVLTEKAGKKVLTSKKMMPGYILVKMIYGDDIWHAVTHTQYVTGFVGPKGHSVSISADEVAKLRLEKITINVNVHAGDLIEIVDGPLVSLVGKVKSVDLDSQKCKALVEMFGRETIVELGFGQIRIVK